MLQDRGYRDSCKLYRDTNHMTSIAIHRWIVPTLHLCLSMYLISVYGCCTHIIWIVKKLLDRRRGRVGKGVGHLAHVWIYGVREVVSSFQILNIFRTLSSWGSDNYWPSAPLLYEVASHVLKTTAILANIIIPGPASRSSQVASRRNTIILDQKATWHMSWINGAIFPLNEFTVMHDTALQGVVPSAVEARTFLVLDLVNIQRITWLSLGWARILDKCLTLLLVQAF